MKSTLSSGLSILTFLVAAPAWASAVNLDSEPTVSSAFSEDQGQFLINSDLHFPVDKYSVEINPISVEKIAIAPSPSEQLTEKMLKIINSLN